MVWPFFLIDEKTRPGQNPIYDINKTTQTFQVLFNRSKRIIKEIPNNYLPMVERANEREARLFSILSDGKTIIINYFEYCLKMYRPQLLSWKICIFIFWERSADTHIDAAMVVVSVIYYQYFKIYRLVRVIWKMKLFLIHIAIGEGWWKRLLCEKITNKF